MLKRILSVLLAMTMALCTAAASAETPDEALRRVTLAVRERCGVGEEYDRFEGSVTKQDSGDQWNLSWSDEEWNQGANIFCDDEGYPYEFYRYDYSADGSWRSYDRYYAPHYPQWDMAACIAAAEEFLEKVLHENESYVFRAEPQTLSSQPLRSCYLYGELVRDGLRTDTDFSIAVETATMQVESFYREDGWTQLRVNEAEATVAEEEAEQRLEAMVRMELEYVRDGEDRAVLRYFPRAEGDFILNAVTGDVIDREEAAALYGTMAEEAAADMRALGAGALKLTEAELAGAQRLEGVMTREALDAAARAMTMLGVTADYALEDHSYVTDGEEISAVLKYRAVADRESFARLTGLTVPDAQDAYTENGETVLTRTITLDAFTGRLKAASATGGNLYGIFDLVKDEEKAEECAKEFLAAHNAEHADSLLFDKVYVSDEEYWFEPCARMTFVRMENGVPFPEDATVVSYNMATGYIDEFRQKWTQEIAFEPVENVVDAVSAYAAYCDAMRAELCWRSIPDASYAGEDQPLTLTRCYELTAEPEIAAIGAKDGLPVAQRKEAETPAYDDLSGHPAESAALRLAQYHIGFAGDSLKPEQEMTLYEAVCLLMQAGGSLDVWNVEPAEIRGAACGEWMLLGDEELSGGVTRGELCVMLLRMSGYANAAQLTGAFRCSFADAETFAADVYGYYALAEAMGVAVADEEGRFAPEEKLTRAETLIMLDRFLSR